MSVKSNSGASPSTATDISGGVFRNREAPYYVKALAMAIPALMLGLQISGWIFFLPGAIHGHCDFRQLYAAGYMVRTGHRAELYDYSVEQRFQDSLASPEQIALPFNHLAYESLIFVPYSYFSYRLGYFLFLATNVVLMILAIRLMAPWTGNLRSMFFWLPAAVFFTFLPVAAALMQGQDSIILLLLFCGAFVLLSQGKGFPAGFLIGLGLFKFQVVLPVAVLFFLWRRWRFVAGFVASSAMAVLISMSLVGWTQMNIYVHSLSSMSMRETALDQFRFAIYPIEMPNLRGLVYVLIASHVSRFWTQLLTLGSSLAVMLWAVVKERNRPTFQQFRLAATIAAFVSYHLYIHDLSILLIPVVLIMNEYARTWVLSAAGLAGVVMFSSPAVIALTDVHPFIIGLAVLLLLVVRRFPGIPCPDGETRPTAD
jgi:hypothetical protein